MKWLPTMHVQGGTTSLSSPLYRHCLKSEDIVITRSIFISLGTIGCSAGVPCQRPLPDGRRRDTMSSTFNLITVSGCALYVSVDVWRLSFPGYRLSSLEQSAMPRHCTVTACFLQSSEDRSLQMQFSLTILLCPRSDTRHYGHDNRCFYLLTYLLYIAQSARYNRKRASIDILLQKIIPLTDVSVRAIHVHVVFVWYC